MEKLSKAGIRIPVLLIFILFLAAGHSKLCQAKGVASLDAVILEQAKVQLTWRTHANISRLEIFRERMEDDKGCGKVRVATLKGGRESYLDRIRPDKDYKYQIVAYEKKGKKYKEIGSSSCFTYCDWGRAEWEEYAFCDTYTTPEFIRLYFGMGWRSKLPRGYEIFRSVDGERYKCIQTVDAEEGQWLQKYIDATVQSHQKYYYKVRAFWESGKKGNGKRRYSPFSVRMGYTAENSYGIFSVKALTEEGAALPYLTICLASDEGNGDFIFDYGYAFGYLCSGDSDLPLYCTQYSFDGENWFPVGAERMVLKAGQSIYLQLTEYMGGTVSFWQGRGTEIEDISGRYHDLSYILSIDLDKLTARAGLDAELYH